MGVAPATFVNFIENHDQVANSADGARLRLRTSPGRYRAMTALMLLMPGTPMLFQGQEFGASTPFLYFADHRPDLAQAVQKGRAEFLSQFVSDASPEVQRMLAPPHAVETFERSKLDWHEHDRHDDARRLHRDLIALRRRDAAFAAGAEQRLDGSVIADEALALRYFAADPADELVFEHAQ